MFNYLHNIQLNLLVTLLFTLASLVDWVFKETLYNELERNGIFDYTIYSAEFMRMRTLMSKGSGKYNKKCCSSLINTCAYHFSVNFCQNFKTLLEIHQL